MKLRHAALASVGWYLMLPPPRRPIFPYAPLAAWEWVGSFDTAAECMEAMTKRQNQASALLGDMPTARRSQPLGS